MTCKLVAGLRSGRGRWALDLVDQGTLRCHCPSLTRAMRYGQILSVGRFGLELTTGAAHLRSRLVTARWGSDLPVASFGNATGTAVAARALAEGSAGYTRLLGRDPRSRSFDKFRTSRQCGHGRTAAVPPPNLIRSYRRAMARWRLTAMTQARYLRAGARYPLH